MNRAEIEQKAAEILAAVVESGEVDPAGDNLEAALDFEARIQQGLSAEDSAEIVRWGKRHYKD